MSILLTISFVPLKNETHTGSECHWGCVNEDRVFIFGWTKQLSMWARTFRIFREYERTFTFLWWNFKAEWNSGVKKTRTFHSLLVVGQGEMCIHPNGKLFECFRGLECWLNLETLLDKCPHGPLCYLFCTISNWKCSELLIFSMSHWKQKVLVSHTFSSVYALESWIHSLLWASAQQTKGQSPWKSVSAALNSLCGETVSRLMY